LQFWPQEASPETFGYTLVRAYSNSSASLWLPAGQSEGKRNILSVTFKPGPRQTPAMEPLSQAAMHWAPSI